MNIRDLTAHVDHTLLRQTSTWEEIRQICDDGIRFGAASVCIPPSFVQRAAQYAAGRIAICTVIGFPNGYSTTAVKSFEAADAVKNGADEIDMVIDLGLVRDGDFPAVQAQIEAVKAACGGALMKVIIETCFLTEEEKIRLCQVVTDAGADYIKTSTGFGGGGATFDDVILFREHVGPGVKIKAAGGIASLEDAEKFIELGADRLGTSRVINLIKPM